MTAPKLTSDDQSSAPGGLFARTFRTVSAWAASETGGWIIVSVLAFTAIIGTTAALVLPRVAPAPQVQEAETVATASDVAALSQNLTNFTLAPEAVQDISQDQARAWNAALPFSTDPIRPARPLFASPADVESYSRALDCLTTAVYYEAASESAAGQAAVAQVVLNRARHPAYPRTICGVVFQGSERATGCQFSFTCDGAMARTPSMVGWARARGVAMSALNGHVAAAVGTATHYHTDWVAPYWAARLSKLVKIGAHIFYRWPGTWGLPAAFTGNYAGSEPIIGKMAGLSTIAPSPPAEVFDVADTPSLRSDVTTAALVPKVAQVSSPDVQQDGASQAATIETLDQHGVAREQAVPLPAVRREVPIMADPMANLASPAQQPHQRQRIAAPSNW